MSCEYSSHSRRQGVSRFRTRGESEKSIARRWLSTQVKDPLWLRNPGQMSIEVQNGVLLLLQKRLVSSKKIAIRHDMSDHQKNESSIIDPFKTKYFETFFNALN